MVDESEFDEFYGRDRDTELDQLDENIKEIAQTIPEPEKTLFENEACHLDDSCFRVASHLSDVLLLTPRDKHKEIIRQTINDLAKYLEWEVNQADGSTHPDFTDKDYDTIDKLIHRLSDKIDQIKF